MHGRTPRVPAPTVNTDCMRSKPLSVTERCDCWSKCSPTVRDGIVTLTFGGHYIDISSFVVAPPVNCDTIVVLLQAF